jgi:hypothetical protein
MIQMAMGFLFLKKGTMTFGNSNKQVFYILLSCYPQYASNLDDNKYYLQVYWYFYILAI